jgi:hypothetical protein
MYTIKNNRIFSFFSEYPIKYIALQGTSLLSECS